MVRNNQDRVGPRNSGSDEVPESFKQMMNPMDFVAPTDFVELPSKGQGYPKGHPLDGQDTIEIRFMTAKEEDMLTSRTLLKKGVAIDRVIASLIVNKSIDAQSVLIGDRNAILIKARASAYGHMYKTSVTCPECGEACKRAFNLEEPKIYNGDEWEDYNVKQNEEGNFVVTVPYSKMEVECRLLRGYEEHNIVKNMQDKKKAESLVTAQLKSFIVAVNGMSENPVIDYFVNNVIAPDSRYLRNAMKAVTPDIRIVKDFECPSCGHEQELEVPFGADFFWPDGGVR